MKTKFLSSVGMTLMGALCMVAVRPVMAADAPAPNPPAAPPAQKPAVAPAPAVPVKLGQPDLDTVLQTADDYAKMLQKAGYTVKIGKTADGNQALSLTWKNGTWSYYVDVTLNKIGNEEYLSLISPLANIPDMTKIPVVSIVRLLEVQDATRGWFFVLNSKSKKFYICRLVPNSKVTTNLLLEELKAYEANVQGTEQFWNPARWVAKKPAAPAQPAPAQPAPAQPAPAPTEPKTK